MEQFQQFGHWENFVNNKNVKVIDRGWLKLKKQFDSLNKSYTAVGYIASESGQENVTKAVVNESGSVKRNIPARPFNAQTFEKNKNAILKMKIELYNALIDGNLTPRQALFKLGEWYTGIIKHQIKMGSFVENALSTIARKKSSRPLINTGEMRNTTTHIEVMK